MQERLYSRRSFLKTGLAIAAGTMAAGIVGDGLLRTVAGSPAQKQAQPQPTNQVLQWNRNLLTIVRTPGAQPATMHATHSFAIMHAAIYDAVNSIDETHRPYLVDLPGVSRFASQEAAAASASHQALVHLYPKLQATLDAQLQQSLAQIQDGSAKTEGIQIGQSVAD
jgi:hypothetical protein